ncbi:MAG: hypothetical protein HFI32_12300 [Lachnospiraceae bacterium]|nr:hypothetical protein [Lachnospiraceae bacterium]
MSKETDKKNKSLMIVCIVAVVIILILVGVIIMMMRAQNTVGEAEAEKEKRPVVVLPENAEEVAEQIFSDDEESEGVPLSYQVTMNSTWEFEDGKSESSNAYVANSKDNETPVYFDVVRNDTQETIYQSPVIPVGQDLSSITLDQDLDAGDYECTLTYHLIDEEQNTLTTVNMWVMVQVKN